MYDRDMVDLALYALGEGMMRREVAELVGASRTAVASWAAGRLPQRRPEGTIRVRTKTVVTPALNAGRGPRTRWPWRRAHCSRRRWTT